MTEDLIEIANHNFKILSILSSDIELIKSELKQNRENNKKNNNISPPKLDEVVYQEETFKGLIGKFNSKEFCIDDLIQTLHRESDKIKICFSGVFDPDNVLIGCKENIDHEIFLQGRWKKNKNNEFLFFVDFVRFGWDRRKTSINRIAEFTEFAY